jgi:hypothetical protein
MSGYTEGPWEIHENATLEIHPINDEHGVIVIAERIILQCDAIAKGKEAIRKGTPEAETFNRLMNREG